MAKRKIITAIKTLRACGASGQSLAANTVYSVPAEVSLEDAEILIRMMKAQPDGGEEPVTDIDEPVSLLDLLDQSVGSLETALEEKYSADELTVTDIDKLEAAERNGNTRKGALAVFAEARTWFDEE